MSCNINYIETFCTVCETLSFSKASKILATSQPAITRKIKLLELHLGYELFIRNNNRVLLTRQGQAYFDLVAPSFKILKTSLNKDFDQKMILKIGTIYEAGQGVLLPRIQKLIEKKSFSKVDIIFDSSVNLIKKLENGELDLVLVHIENDSKSIRSLKILEDDTYLVGPKSLDFNIKKEGNIYSLVTYRDSDKFTESFLTKKYSPSQVKTKFKVAASVNSHQSMLNLCLSLNALCVVPASSFLSLNEKEFFKIHLMEKKSHGLYICVRENYLENAINQEMFNLLVSSFI